MTPSLRLVSQYYGIPNTKGNGLLSPSPRKLQARRCVGVGLIFAPLRHPFVEHFSMFNLKAVHINARVRSASCGNALPSGAMRAYLRRTISPSQVELRRMPACVAAKQNGFWQIVR